MREQLAQRRLVNEHSAWREHPRHFAQRVDRARDVIAGAEIDHEIERRGRERHGPRISRYQFGPNAGAVDPETRLHQEPRLDVEAGEPDRLEQPREGRQGNPAAAADLEYAHPHRQPQGPDQGRDFQRLLTAVPALFIGEWAVFVVFGPASNPVGHGRGRHGALRGEGWKRTSAAPVTPAWPPA